MYLGDGQHLKAALKHQLNPTQNLHCVGMLMSNLAEPEFTTVSCKETLASELFCHKPNQSQVSFNNVSNVQCYKEHLLKGKCFSFKWTQAHSSKKMTNNISMSTFDNIQKFLYLFASVRTPFPIHMSDSSQTVTFKRCITILCYEKHAVNNTTSAFLISSEPVFLVRIGLNMFKCDSKTYISVATICDGHKDCQTEDDGDEVGCNSMRKEDTNDKPEVFSQGRQNCSFFYQAIHGTCVMFGMAIKIVSKEHNNSNNILFQCQGGFSIYNSLVNDLVPDCGPQAEDEYHLTYMLTTAFQFSCSQLNQIACREGHTKCFNISEICSYQLDHNGNLSPCRTGEHLESCGQFQCNSKFKCQNSFCIPFSYICDGKWDCLGGDDENSVKDCHFPKFIGCKEMFKCAKSGQCSHMNDICDGTKNCPLGDDEFLCSLKSVTCPITCDCLTYAAKCVIFFLSEIPNLFPFFVVQLKSCHFFQILTERRVHVPVVWHLAETLENVHRLVLSENNIENVCLLLVCAGNIVDIDLSINNITAISEECFQHQVKMESINVRNNNITFVSKGGFSHSKVLRYLDLSHNKLKSFTSIIFSKTAQILLLNLIGNSLSDIETCSFDNVNVKILLLMKHEICCVAAQAEVCIANKSWFASCHNLVPTHASATTNHVSATVVLSMNILLLLCVFIIRVSDKQKFGVFEISACFITIGDILHGVHLGILSAAGIHFGESFVLSESVWRQGIMCTVVFALALWHSVLSPNLLVFFSIMRTLTMIAPSQTSLKSMTLHVSGYLNCYLFSFVLVSLVVFWKVFWIIVPTFSLCSPFVDSSNKVTMVTVLTGIVAFTQFSALALIIVANSLLIQHIFQSEQKMQKSCANRKSKAKTYIQILVLTGVQGLCWISSNVLFLSSILKNEDFLQLSVWNIVAIAPINSIANPVFFLISTFQSLHTRRTSKLSKKFQTTKAGKRTSKQQVGQAYSLLNH